MAFVLFTTCSLLIEQIPCPNVGEYFKLPADFDLLFVSFLYNSINLLFQHLFSGYSSTEALLRQSRKFYFYHVQPGGSFRRIVELKTFCKCPGLIGRQLVIKRTGLMGVEIVLHDNDL